MAPFWIPSPRIVKPGHEVLGRYAFRPLTKRDGGPQRFTHLADSPRLIIEQNQADLDPHHLAAEKTRAVEAMLLDSVRPLPLIEVVKSYHGRRPMSVGTGSEHRMAKALLEAASTFVMRCFRCGGRRRSC